MYYCFGQFFWFSSASIHHALLTQEPIELDTSHFHRKICLNYLSRLFYSNIMVWGPNLQQTLKLKFCNSNNRGWAQRYLLTVISCSIVETMMPIKWLNYNQFRFSSWNVVYFEPLQLQYVFDRVNYADFLSPHTSLLEWMIWPTMTV